MALRSEELLEGLAREYRKADADRERELQARLLAQKVRSDREIDRVVRDAKQDLIAWRAAHLLAVSSRSNQQLKDFLRDAVTGSIQPPKGKKGPSSWLHDSRYMAICMTVQALCDEGHQLIEGEDKENEQTACGKVAKVLGIKAKSVHEIWMMRDSLPWP